MGKPKVLFILPSLKAGGAERVISYLSQTIDREKFSPILLITGFEKDAVYPVTEIPVVYLNKKRVLQAIPNIVGFLRRIKPDLVMSSISHINISLGFLAIFFRKIKFIGREASVISVMNTYSKSNDWLNKRLIALFYPFLSRIVCQSKDMKVDLIKNFDLDEKKLFVINNPITVEIETKNPYNILPDFIDFITVGRLSKEKGHERILYALSEIKMYDFRYTIIGNGPLKEDFLQLVSDLELTDKVEFISYSSNVPNILMNKHVFLQGSFVEGFPNGVLESCLVGTPVLAFNAPGGTREIVKNGVNGYIVFNQEEYVDKLKNIKELLQLEPKKISDFVRTKFESKTIIAQYESLFNSLITRV